MGGSSPNSDYYYYFFFCVCVFRGVFLLNMFPKKMYKNGLKEEWVESGQSEFFSDFFIFFNLTKPINMKMSIHLNVK